MTRDATLSFRHLLNTSHKHVCDIAAYSLYFLMPTWVQDAKENKEILKYIPVLCLALLSLIRIIIANYQDYTQYITRYAVKYYTFLNMFRVKHVFKMFDY